MQRRVRGEKRASPHKQIREASRPIGIRPGVELSRDQIYAEMWWHRPVGEESIDALDQLASKLALNGLAKAKKEFTFTIVSPLRVISRLDARGMKMTTGQLEQLRMDARSRQPESLGRDVEARVLGIRKFQDNVLGLPNSGFYYDRENPHLHLVHGLVTPDQSVAIPKSIILGPMNHGRDEQNEVTA